MDVNSLLVLLHRVVVCMLLSVRKYMLPPSSG
jgi:hypothetical protein